MEKIIDTSVWVDFFRPKTPHPLRELAASYIDEAKNYLCEPVYFELLSSPPKQFKKKLEFFLKQYPMITTPLTLWKEAVELSQACQAKRFTLGVMDLLIAQVAIHYQLPLVTFDKDFVKLKAVCSLEVIWHDRKLALH